MPCVAAPASTSFLPRRLLAMAETSGPADTRVARPCSAYSPLHDSGCVRLLMDSQQPDGSAMANEGTAKRYTRNYTTWTDDMDKALLDVLVEHHNNGDHSQNGWKPHVYNAAIKVVRQKCSGEITKEKICSRCKTFDKHYDIISKILCQSGFGWDWDNNKLSMDSESVWDTYVEANKGAACYKNKVVKNWDSICTIYSKDHAKGDEAKTAAKTVAEAVIEVDEVSPELPHKK